MNMLQNAPVTGQTFSEFLFHNRRNRIILYLSAAAIVIQFSIFKYLYPFANYIHDDSFFYLNSAYENLTIATYPIGYSKFLRLVSVFAKPDWVLVSLQYLMILCSTLFFLFTLFYFYKVGNVAQAVLFCFMTINPLFLHLGNMVSSDGLFVALSMTWFALLLWIIYQPSHKIILWHGIVLLAVFTVRYNALIYPFISLLAFGLSKLSFRKKIAGLAFSLLLFGWFIGLSMFQFKKLTGHWQYSPFSGWLLANNAMYAYREVSSSDLVPVPSKFRVLDKMIRDDYAINGNTKLGYPGVAYMWMPNFPLMQYRDSLFKNDKSATQLKKWASMGPLYSSYGWFLVKNYPGHFFRHFVWPNAIIYMHPPVEFLGYYNMGFPTIQETAVKWFGYKNNQVKTRMKSGAVWVLRYCRPLVSCANYLAILMFLSYLLLKGWEYGSSFNKIIMLSGFAWMANAGFIIFTCAAALRFQVFPVLLSITISLLLIDWMAQLVQHMKRQSEQQTADSQYPQNVSA